MNIRKMTKHAIIILAILSILFIFIYYFPPKEIVNQGFLEAYRSGHAIIRIPSEDIIHEYVPLPLMAGAVLFLISSFSCIVVFLSWLFAQNEARHNPKIISSGKSPQTIPEYMNPLQTAFYYNGKIVSKDCVALIFHWAQKGYVAIQGLPENLSQQGKLLKTDILPSDAPSSETILFDALFDKSTDISWNQIGFIIDNHFEQIEQAVYNENYFGLYNNRARGDALLAFVLCFVPIFLLQIFRQNNVLLVSLPSLLLFAAAAYFMYSAVARRSFEKKRRLISCIASIICGIGALCVHILLPFKAPAFSQWFDYYAYIVALIALPLAAALDRPTITAAQKLHDIKAFRNYLSTAYPAGLSAEAQPNYIYASMPYAIALSAETLLNERITQEALEAPAWYEPIWYEDRDSKGKPATLARTTIWAYYDYAVKDASHKKVGVLGKIKQERGNYPLGPLSFNGDDGTPGGDTY